MQPQKQLTTSNDGLSLFSMGYKTVQYPSGIQLAPTMPEHFQEVNFENCANSWWIIATDYGPTQS